MTFTPGIQDLLPACVNLRLRRKLPVCTVEKGSIAAHLNPCETEAE